MEVNMASVRALTLIQRVSLGVDATIQMQYIYRMISTVWKKNTSKRRIVLWASFIFLLLLQQLGSYVPDTLSALYATIVVLPTYFLLPVASFLIGVDAWIFLKHRFPLFSAYFLLFFIPVFIIVAFVTEGLALLFAPVAVPLLCTLPTADILFRSFKGIQKISKFELAMGLLGLLLIVASLFFLPFVTSSGGYLM